VIKTAHLYNHLNWYKKYQNRIFIEFPIVSVGSPIRDVAYCTFRNSMCYKYSDINNFLFFSFILFYFFGFYFSFSLLYWKDDEGGTWQGSHMTGHMMWCHRPRLGWKDLEDDVRAHGVCMVALSKKWGEHEVEAWTIGQV